MRKMHHGRHATSSSRSGCGLGVGVLSSGGSGCVGAGVRTARAGVGADVGVLVGPAVGTGVGSTEGWAVELFVGRGEGTSVGAEAGFAAGIGLGRFGELKRALRYAPVWGHPRELEQALEY